ncbi:unnamed protein product, partial [Ixodes hexagonus]
QVSLSVLVVLFICLAYTLYDPSNPHKGRDACRTCASPPHKRPVGCDSCKPATSDRPVPQTGLKGNAVSESPTFQDVFPYSYLVNVKSLCVRHRGPLDYLIAVNSLAKNLVDRNILRSKLWTLRNESSKIKFLFFLGRPVDPVLADHVNEEVGTSEDLVIADFDGTSENSTLTSLMILHWTMKFCRGTKFLVKIDDSGRVNTQLLKTSREFFEKLSMDFDMFGSFVSLDGEPCLESQRETTVGDCPGRGYLSGCAYMVANRMVEPLLKAARGHETVPPEDLFVTDVLARDAGARRADVAYFDGCYLTYPKRPTVWQQGPLQWLKDRFRARGMLLVRKLGWG